MRLESIEIPRKGRRYRALRDIQVRSIITFSAPCSGGSEGTLPKGEVIIIENDPPAGATAAYARPEHFAAFEDIFVPEEDRKHPRYSDYALVMDFRDLATEFELLNRRGMAAFFVRSAHVRNLTPPRGGPLAPEAGGAYVNAVVVADSIGAAEAAVLDELRAMGLEAIEPLDIGLASDVRWTSERVQREWENLAREAAASRRALFGRFNAYPPGR